VTNERGKEFLRPFCLLVLSQVRVGVMIYDVGDEHPNSAHRPYHPRLRRQIHIRSRRIHIGREKRAIPNQFAAPLIAPIANIEGRHQRLRDGLCLPTIREILVTVRSAALEDDLYIDRVALQGISSVIRCFPAIVSRATPAYQQDTNRIAAERRSDAGLAFRPRNSHVPETKPGGRMQKDYHPELITFEDVARHYLQEPASEEEADLGWFGLQSLTISEVIERACASIRKNGLLHSPSLSG